MAQDSITEFDIECMQPNAFINILGKRGAGKTHLIRRLLGASPLTGRPGIVMGQRAAELTTDMSSDQKRKVLAVTEYDGALLQSWTSKMIHASPPWFVVLNSCLWNCSWHRDPAVRDLLEHRDVFQVTSIYSSNSPLTQLPPSVFACIDYTMLFNFGSASQSGVVPKLFQIYGKIAFGDEGMDAFERVMTALTDHDALVIDHRNARAYVLSKS